jgi:peptidyl-prolyl cis-trans isomerase A (cyclophilin A)
MQRPLSFFISLFFITSTGIAQPPGAGILKMRAPETFRASFKTSKGDFIIEAYRKWSPLGVDRLYQLIKTGFYDNTLIFRVEPSFVIQFGISDDQKINRFWDPKKLRDEPVRNKNMKAVISYARGGPNDRTTQLFINAVDNFKLDTAMRGGVKGFTPVAKIIKGMNIVAMFNSRYGKVPVTVQDSLYKYGNSYFEAHFPGLDRILVAKIIR